MATSSSPTSTRANGTPHTSHVRMVVTKKVPNCRDTVTVQSMITYLPNTNKKKCFDSWIDLPVCFQQGGLVHLVPSNPREDLMRETLLALPPKVTDFQFKPKRTTMHAFTDGTCFDSTHPNISLAAWAGPCRLNVRSLGFYVLLSAPDRWSAPKLCQ